MQKVTSLKHYFEIIRGTKERLGRLITNNCLFPEAVERYIALERLFYEYVDAGVWFYSDEEEFYQAYYYLKEDMPVCLPCRKDRQILLQHIYRNDKKSESMRKLEEYLTAGGFVKADVMRHASLENPERLLHRIEKTITGIERILKREGFSFGNVTTQQLGKVMAFRKTIREIPCHQLPFFSAKEYMQEAEEGRFCCMWDMQGNIIAARHLILTGKKSYGWVGVKEEYKNLYGIAVFFLYHALQYICGNGIKMCSWVDETNGPSVRYHEHIGSVWTEHKMDEWLLKEEAVAER